MTKAEYLAQELAKKGVKEVPHRFVKPIHERPHTEDEDTVCSPSSHHSIPVIDLAELLTTSGSASSRSQTLQQIHEACQNWGFFQVVNHGIPSSLLRCVKDVSKRFFQLPLEEKQKCAMKPGGILGYGRHYEQSPDAVFDWVDCVLHYVCPDYLRDEENTWPSQPPEYREITDTYGKEIERLTLLFLRAFSENLGLQPTDLEKGFGEFCLAVRLNYYPPCPQPNLVMGISPHSDSGCFTFLLQDDVEGLQVRKNGQWVTVQPLADALVVNVADMLQVMSNGRYVSVEHRALVNCAKERMSIVAFYLPSADVLISPITALSDATHPLLYSGIKYRDYLSTYMGIPLEGKARVDSLLLAR